MGDISSCLNFAENLPVITYSKGESLRELYQYQPGTTGAIQLYLRPEALPQLDAVAARLRSALADAGYRLMDPDPRAFWMKFDSVAREDWTGQKLDVTSWEDELSFLTWTLQANESRARRAGSYPLMAHLLQLALAWLLGTLDFLPLDSGPAHR